MFSSLSPYILPFLLPFATLFSPCNWRNAQTLLLGAILARGKRTVCGVLRALGLQGESGFSKYHRLLNRVEWAPRKGAGILLSMLLRLASQRPVIVIDETLERRKGKKIKEKGLYRDAVRSSGSNVVKAHGLKWLVMSLSVRFSFAMRPFALPFFTVLQPSTKCDQSRNRRHKTTLDWTRQMIKQVMRWIPGVSFIVVGDGAFASGALAWLCLKHRIALVSRLKMNARLFSFPEEAKPGKKGRRRKKGVRLRSFKEMLDMPGLSWIEVEIAGYGGEKKRVHYLTNTSLWCVDGYEPVPIRWVLVTDPTGKLAPLPLMSTDVTLSAEEIIALYIERWSIEVTFEEVREHLGVETQRQWSEKAIARTTPILMGLYSQVCLMANEMSQGEAVKVESTAWYEKKTTTFADLLKAVRMQLWRDSSFCRKMVAGTSCEKDSHEEDYWMDALVECLSRAA